MQIGKKEIVTDKTISFLKEWTVRYIKNKDLITKKIVSIEEGADGFKVIRADRELQFFIEPFLADVNRILLRIQQGEHGRALVCFHTKENFDVLMKQWKRFVDAGKNLTMYFVNPFSKTDRVLTLSPYTHDLIADESTLMQGLKTMSGSVEFTTEEEVKKIIAS